MCLQRCFVPCPAALEAYSCRPDQAVCYDAEEAINGNAVARAVARADRCCRWLLLYRPFAVRVGTPAGGRHLNANKTGRKIM